MRNVKHITPWLSHNFPQVQSIQSTTSQLFNLRALLTMQRLTYKDVSVRKLSHRRTCLCATYHIISYVLSRPPCFHTFLTYEVMSMRNFKHITPCLSHNFPQVHSKQGTTSRLFNLWTLLTMQLLTYKDVSVCKLSHMRTCLFATCHKISNILSRPPCFHALCWLRRVHVRVRALKNLSLHTFRIRKTCTCVTFNTWHPVCHIISHRCTWNEIQPHDF